MNVRVNKSCEEGDVCPINTVEFIVEFLCKYTPVCMPLYLQRKGKLVESSEQKKTVINFYMANQIKGLSWPQKQPNSMYLISTVCGFFCRLGYKFVVNAKIIWAMCCGNKNQILSKQIIISPKRRVLIVKPKIESLYKQNLHVKLSRKLMNFRFSYIVKHF